MPLDAEEKRMLPGLNALDDTVIPDTRRDEGRRERRQGLMMDTVDPKPVDTQTARKQTSLDNLDFVGDAEKSRGSEVPRRGTGQLPPEVLMQGPAEHHVDQLTASTYTQDGLPRLDGGAEGPRLESIPPRIAFPTAGGGSLPVKGRIDIGSAGKDEAIIA